MKIWRSRAARFVKTDIRNQNDTKKHAYRVYSVELENEWNRSQLKWAINHFIQSSHGKITWIGRTSGKMCVHKFAVLSHHTFFSGRNNDVNSIKIRSGTIFHSFRTYKWTDQFSCTHRTHHFIRILFKSRWQKLIGIFSNYRSDGRLFQLVIGIKTNKNRSEFSIIALKHSHTRTHKRLCTHSTKRYNSR